jgi:hypothetical protein
VCVPPASVVLVPYLPLWPGVSAREMVRTVQFVPTIARTQDLAIRNSRVNPLERAVGEDGNTMGQVMVAGCAEQKTLLILNQFLHKKDMSLVAGLPHAESFLPAYSS